MNTDFYYMRNILQHDAEYLRAEKIVRYPVVDVTVTDYGKYIQVDRIIQRKPCLKNLKSQISSS